MGQKINPLGFRIGIVKTWNSQWFAEKGEYAKNLLQDHRIREMINEKLQEAGINKLEIERYSDRISVSIHTSRPGVVIGRQGANLTELEEILKRKFQKRFEIKVEEIQKPDLHAKLVADNIAHQISNRISYRRASKMAIQRIMEAGAKGVKIQIKGRLGGGQTLPGENFSLMGRSHFPL